jgi:hypothetical protein
MRLAIYQTTGQMYDQVVNYAKRHNISIQSIKSVTAHTLKRYDGIIFTSEGNVPNLSKVLEQLVLREATLVIYVHSGKGVHAFYNIEKDPYFIDVIHHQLDIMFSQKVKLAIKYIKLINRYKQDLQDTVCLYHQLKEELKAKRILMKKGLSETEAHRFIQSKAMQLRKQKNDIVNLIIENKIDL